MDEVQGTAERAALDRVQEPQGSALRSGWRWDSKTGERGGGDGYRQTPSSFLRVVQSPPQWEQCPTYLFLAGGQVQLPGQQGGARDDL